MKITTRSQPSRASAAVAVDRKFHRFGDRLGKFKDWLAGERWVRRLVITVVVLMIDICRRLRCALVASGAGPVDLDMVTPWLVAAIEENIGHDNTVEIGGTQIERAGRIRIAVRIRDVVVRDRDHAIVASAPKAEVKLSGMALLTGRLRAESLNLVDAELAVRITPDGQVTVSAGDNAKPLATRCRINAAIRSAITVRRRSLRHHAIDSSDAAVARTPNRRRACESPMTVTTSALCWRGWTGSTALA